MTREKRKLIGAGLVVLGIVTIFAATKMADHDMQVQMERNLRANEEWAKDHPGQSSGVGTVSSDAALIPDFFGGVFIIAGVLVLIGKFGGKSVTNPIVPGGTSPS